MRHHPYFDDFVQLARAPLPGKSLAGEEVRLVPVYRQLVSDTLTPVSAFRKIAEGDWAFLFESVVGGERVGRYSFLGTGPFLRFEAFGTRVRIQTGTSSRAEWVQQEHPDPLRLLEEKLSCYRVPPVPGLPRFLGGAVGYAGYDTVRYVERLPNAPADDRQLPDLCFAFYDRMVLFDHINKTVSVVAHAIIPSESSRPGHDDEARTDHSRDLRKCYNDACTRVDELVEALHRHVDLELADITPLGEVNKTFTSNFARADFEDAVERCREYIRAGDIFQVVLSQRLQTQTTAHPFDIYRTLRVVNPSPFLFYLQLGTISAFPEGAGKNTTSEPLFLVGSSPEIMARVEGDLLTIRPLAGTRKRGQTVEEDERLAVELLQDPKERAEHIMLVDLGRNDVGRVARYNTVQLSDVLTVERYSHVMHLCSTVTGRLRPDQSAFDALRACLPAGTLSRAPKIRAMEIIDELEPHRRGPYGGAVGYVDFSGNMDTCIALRTLVLKGQTVYLQAGAGIVVDSIPANEYEETMNKARGLLRALEMAEDQLSNNT